MDHIDFVAPVKVGDILILKASVNRAFNTSMEVGVKAMVEDVFAQTLRHVASAYLTFVAVDKHGERVQLAQIIPETDHQKRRFDDAGRRRELRSEEVTRKKELRANAHPRVAPLKGNTDGAHRTHSAGPAAAPRHPAHRRRRQRQGRRR
jgi:hypothetical protein